MRRVLLGLILVPALVLAGCAGPPSASTRSAQSAPGPEVPGRVVGLVSSQLGLPLGGVDITVDPVGLGTVTDDQGRFHFDDVPAGDYRLHASKLGFEAHNHTLTVRPGSDVEVAIELALLPLAAPSTIVTTVYSGFIQCSANAVYATNFCGNAVGPSQDHLVLPLEVSRAPKEILYELVWTSTTPITGQQLQIDVCAPGGGGPGELHCAGAAVRDEFHQSATGSSPMSLSIAYDAVPKNLRELEAWVGSGQFSPYPTLAQSFTLYATVCYGSPCPDGFSARNG